MMKEKKNFFIQISFHLATKAGTSDDAYSLQLFTCFMFRIMSFESIQAEIKLSF